MVELKKKKKAKGKGLLYDAFLILPKSRQNYLAVCVCDKTKGKRKITTYISE